MSEKIAVVGLGRMGWALATRLAGLELLVITRFEGLLREAAGTLGNEDVAAIIKHRFTQS